MTRAKSTIKLYYKYSGYPWTLYDQTRDESWALIQWDRMKMDHPGVEYRRDPDVKKSK